jgi:hypothetical protein
MRLVRNSFRIAILLKHSCWSGQRLIGVLVRGVNTFFLEANPSPMFLHFEEKTGFPITQQLVKLLMN